HRRTSDLPQSKTRKARPASARRQPTPARTQGPAPPRVGKQPELRAYFFRSGDSHKNDPANNFGEPLRFLSRLFPPPVLPPEFSVCRLNLPGHRSADRRAAPRLSARVRSAPRTRLSNHA